jgi:hypothetical protein
LQGWVIDAENDGGGWVPIVFHDIDTADSEGHIPPATFVQFLDWLQPRAANGTVVRTVRSVMGYPEVAPASPLAAPVTADKATAFASLKAPKRQDVDKIFVRAAMIEPGTLSAFGTVALRGVRYRLGKVFRKAAPGKLVKLRLHLTKKGLRAAKRALRRHKRVRAVITIGARDLAYNKITAQRTIRLRR